MNKTTIQTLALKMVQIFHNPRADYNLNLEPLKADLLENGQLTPVQVALRSDGSHHMMMGHRRYMAMCQIAEEEPELFEEQFGGIRAIVWEGLTEAKIERLKVDEGNTQPLSTKFELLNCALALFNAGATEKSVANALNSLMERIVNPLSAKQRQEIEILQKEPGNEAKVEELILAARRGTTQHLKQVCQLPACVRLSYYRKHTGHNPAGFTDYLPSLTNGEVKKLHEAFMKDLENPADKASIKVGGPRFWKLWNKYVTEEQEKPGSAPRTKAMAAKDVDQVIGQSGSVDLKQFIEATRDCKVEFDFAAFGAMVYIAGNLQRNDPDFWEQCVMRSEELDAEAAAKMQAEGTSEAATTTVED